MCFTSSWASPCPCARSAQVGRAQPAWLRARGAPPGMPGARPAQRWWRGSARPSWSWPCRPAWWSRRCVPAGCPPAGSSAAPAGRSGPPRPASLPTQAMVSGLRGRRSASLRPPHLPVHVGSGCLVLPGPLAELQPDVLLPSPSDPVLLHAAGRLARSPGVALPGSSACLRTCTWCSSAASAACASTSGAAWDWKACRGCRLPAGCPQAGWQGLVRCQGVAGLSVGTRRWLSNGANVGRLRIMQLDLLPGGLLLRPEALQKGLASVVS